MSSLTPSNPTLEDNLAMGSNEAPSDAPPAYERNTYPGFPWPQRDDDSPLDRATNTYLMRQRSYAKRIFYSSLRASEVIKECYRSCPHNMNDLNTLAAALEHVRCISKTVLENMDSSTADFHQAALDSERPLKCLETRSDHLVERGAMTVEGARFDAQTKLMVEDARDLKHLSDLTTGFPNLSSYVVDDDKTTVLQEAISFVSNPSQSGSSPVTRDQLKGLRRYMGRCLAHDDNSITRMKCDQILNDHAKLRYQYEVARSALEAADLDERSSHREARPWVSIPCTLM